MQQKTTLSSTVDKSSQGISLVEFLSIKFKYHTSEGWERRILNKDICVNGAGSSPEYILEEGDVVSYSILLREPPVSTDIRIMHNEDAFLIADKPGNLPVHSYGKYVRNTFIYLLKRMMSDKGYDGYLNPAHRLDRETSGLIIVAKSKGAARNLTNQFRKGLVKKEYITIARGRMKTGSSELEGWIINDKESKISVKQCMTNENIPGAKLVGMRIETTGYAGNYTILKCFPATGRTNQIRAQLAHIGHPLAGDKLYGRSDEEFLEYRRAAEAGRHDPLPWMDAPRHMLHASAVSFAHPVTGEQVSFECPLPGDMKEFIKIAKR